MSACNGVKFGVLLARLGRMAASGAAAGPAAAAAAAAAVPSAAVPATAAAAAATAAVSPAAAAAGLFSAGQCVRVWDGAASSRRALLLCLHADGCDVEFEGTDEEESNVPLSRVATLLDFEAGAVRGATEGPTDVDDTLPAPARAEQHTQQGNQLFKLHDHAAAAEEYAAGPLSNPQPGEG